jgi:hypothetical protein
VSTRKALLLGPLALCACATAASPGGEIESLCRGDALAAFAGREVTGDVGAEILHASGARTLQWVQPGMMVTMEFRADRVRVWLAPGNRIERAACG